MIRVRSVAAMLILGIVVSFVPIASGDVAAQGGWVCDSYDQTAKRNGTPVPDADGGVYPIVTIHGITGSDGDFDKTIDKSFRAYPTPQPPRTMLDLFAGSKSGDAVPSGLEGAHVFSFSYTDDSLRWVDNAAVGGKFASTIDCLYDMFGVPVSVVAHSMGGLVARWVANTTDEDGVARSTKIGKVVTLGTPYDGSTLSAVANGASDLAATVGPQQVALLNYVCGLTGTETGKGSCGPIPLYASFRSEAGRKLIAGSRNVRELSGWPSGIDVTTIAGQQIVPMALLGSPLNRGLDIGDIAVSTDSATADPGPGQVFTCAYDSTSGSVWKELLLTASARDRRARLTEAFVASPCYHSNLMRNVELTTEVLGLLGDWLRTNRATTPLDGCTRESVAAAVGYAADEVESDPTCIGEWGWINACPAEDQTSEGCIHPGKVIRLADGRWTVVDALLQDCAETFTRLGAPLEIATQFYPPCQQPEPEAPLLPPPTAAAGEVLCPNSIVWLRYGEFNILTAPQIVSCDEATSIVNKFALDVESGDGPIDGWSCSVDFPLDGEPVGECSSDERSFRVEWAQ